MKYILTFICSIALYGITAAQSRTATVEYLKVSRQVIVNDMPFPEKAVRDAIDNKMEQMGYKGKDSKDFTVYKGVKMPELGNDSYDLYFMADKKSKKEKESSTLTLMISKGYDNFISESSDPQVFANAKNFLDSIRNTIAAYDLEQQIKDQDDAVKKATKKYDNFVDDSQGLEKKRKNIEKDIEDNKKDQANQQAEIEKQKQILETLKSKRRQ